MFRISLKRRIGYMPEERGLYKDLKLEPTLVYLATLKGLDEKTDMQKSRLIVGLILIAAAFLLFVFGKGSYSTAGVIALLVLGLVSVTISRRK